MRLHRLTLWLFFGFTRMGKAAARHRRQSPRRGIGIGPLSGQIAFLLASLIGAISNLIVPIPTLYYDTGFLIG